MNHKLIVLIGILIATVLVIAGVYTLITPSHESINDKLDNGTEKNIEFSQSGAHLPKLTVDAEKLEKNAKPSFEVGRKYKYQNTIQEVVEQSYCTGGVCITKNETLTKNIPSEFAVEKIERVDGKDCYVVSRVRIMKISDEEKAAKRMNEEMVKSMEDYFNSQRTYYYYDKETGKCIMQKYSDINGISKTFTKDWAEYSTRDPAILFSDWMLALNDNFMWEQKAEISDEAQGTTTQEVFEYTVKGREKVNGRECFKVEINKKIEETSGEKYKTEEIDLVWIDVKERIMVKTTVKYEGVITSEIELTDEQ
jgi:hypothetical protein